MALVQQNPFIDTLCQLELAQLVQIRGILLVMTTVQRDFFNVRYNNFANSTTWLLIHTHNNLSRGTITGYTSRGLRLQFPLQDLLYFLPLHENPHLVSFWGTYLLFLVTPSNRLLVVNPLREGVTFIEPPPLVRNFRAQAHSLKLVVDRHDLTRFQIIYAEHDRFHHQTLLALYSSVTNGWIVYHPQEAAPGATIQELFDFGTRIPVNSVHHGLSQMISVHATAPQYINTFINEELPPLGRGLNNFEYMYYHDQWLVVLRKTYNQNTNSDTLDGLFPFILGFDMERYHPVSSLPFDLIGLINLPGQRIQRRVCIMEVAGTLHIAVPVMIGEEENLGMYWLTFHTSSRSWNICQRIEIPQIDFGFVAGHTFGCMRMPLIDF